MAEKKKCPNCGRAMKQQFIGLKHCAPVRVYLKFAFSKQQAKV